MKIKDFKLEADAIFVLTENGELLYSEMLDEDEITWFDLTPKEGCIRDLRQYKTEETKED